MKYCPYITDLHLNLHPEQMPDLARWYAHCKKVEDFFTLAYYPYAVKHYPGGFATEEEIDRAAYQAQWEEICRFLQEQNEQDGFISFPGFEWQGTGEDGDHNVYFKGYGESIELPSRYPALVEAYQGRPAIGIPHHLAYRAGNRGKNWETHNETFSPVVEIYSHHGSSERDDTAIPMQRHIHMGPRVQQSSVVSGLKQGYHMGFIASGDNHEVPAMVKNGRACVWADAYSRDALWEALQARRVGGFTEAKLLVWTECDGSPMGSVVKTAEKQVTLHTVIQANAKIERIELYRNGDLAEIRMVQPKALPETFRFKFRIEMGWGPNVKYFPTCTERLWQGTLTTTGKIRSVEPIYSSFENDWKTESETCVSFQAKSRKNNASHWMRGETMHTEGFIFELEGTLDSTVTLSVNGLEKQCTVRQLLEGSSLLVFEQEAKDLIEKTAGISSSYRTDCWYHHAYKVKLYQAYAQDLYETETDFVLEPTEEETSYFVKAVQADGQTGWGSPIWVQKA